MSTSESIATVECFIVRVPRDEPYLGGLRPGESVNRRGYLVRQGNRSVYPTTDTSVLVKVTSRSGAVGWGETYGIVAAGAVTEIIDDLLGPMLEGRDPRDPGVLHEDLYDLMRVRGFFGGYYLDALAGVDIAIWDLAGKLAGVPLARLALPAETRLFRGLVHVTDGVDGARRRIAPAAEVPPLRRRHRVRLGTCA